jgi:hypothetical protein
VAACGSDEDAGSDDTSTTAAAPSDDAVDLTVSVTLDSGSREATLECGDGAASGTGFLAEPAAAEAACALVAPPGEARRRLVEGPQLGQACTQIFGGTEQATVTGTIGGATVDAEFHRADGCGIDDWTLLEPLLGPPDS